ncbi:DDE_3 domain-containing protein [Trichonephila clavipes]|nr:DDE_3 domain-containing protein [Trichonephila clavipes]
MLGSRTDLHIFDAGSVNGTHYCNEILLPYVRLFRGAMGLQFLFMDDNAPCHRTVAAEQLLESDDIERMDWPARSPDLNPIEHVWDFLGRRLAARTLPPVTIRELRLMHEDEWAAMPQQLNDTLILSMGRRCETCLAVSGEIISPTKDRMFLAGHPSQGCFGLQDDGDDIVQHIGARYETWCHHFQLEVGQHAMEKSRLTKALRILSSSS